MMKLPNDTFLKCIPVVKRRMTVLILVSETTLVHLSYHSCFYYMFVLFSVLCVILYDLIGYFCGLGTRKNFPYKLLVIAS